jgi:hypothetical protein
MLLFKQFLINLSLDSQPRFGARQGKYIKKNPRYGKNFNILQGEIEMRGSVIKELTRISSEFHFENSKSLGVSKSWIKVFWT